MYSSLASLYLPSAVTTVTVRSHSQTVCCGNETLTTLRAPPTWPHADFVCRKEAFPKFSSPSRPYTSRGAKRLRVVLRTYTVSACVVCVCACYLCKTNVCNKLHLEKKKQAARCPRCEGGRAGCAAGSNRRLASLILHVLYI